MGGFGEREAYAPDATRNETTRNLGYITKSTKRDFPRNSLYLRRSTVTLQGYHDITMTDTILIVDDEESVRRTFQEWLATALPSANVFVAPDAETALRVANEHAVDLAILDWNLGSGSDGLRLLEDLVEFRPDVVAILVTGFAHQATPLDALRMGVRDYLDKNQDLNRDTFVAAVRKQLDRIRPAKHQRELIRRLAAIREAVEKD